MTIEEKKKELGVASVGSCGLSSQALEQGAQGGTGVSPSVQDGCGTWECGFGVVMVGLDDPEGLCPPMIP